MLRTLLQIENRIPGVPTMLQQRVDMDRSTDGCRGKKGRRAGEALICIVHDPGVIKKEGVRRLDGFATTAAALSHRAPAVPHCPSGHSIDRLLRRDTRAKLLGTGWHEAARERRGA